MAELTIGAKILSSCFLHREIREKGGAYGGGCSASADGTLSFTSYRDPNIARTIDVFAESVPWLLKDGSFSDRDVLEAKLSAFSSIDKPVPPASKGLGSFYTGLTDAMRDRHRRRLLKVTRASIMDAFQQHVLPRMDTHVSIAALGSELFDTSKGGWVTRKI